MVDFGGWEMPVQYSGITDEHHTVRRAVGLFDVSHMGEIEISGPEAARLTEIVTTNAVSRLKIGQAHYSGLLYEHGGFVDDILVHKVADDHFFICVNASNQDKDFEHIQLLNKFDAEVEFASPRYAQIAIQGPKALETLQKLTPAELTPIRYYWFVDDVVSGVPARIARTGYTGEDGFEIVVAEESNRSTSVWERLLEAGRGDGIQPCGLGCRDTLRLEAAMPLYGHELSEDVDPLTAGLSFAVKLDKPDFIGREALLKIKDIPNRPVRVGLKLASRRIAREHAEIYVAETRIGQVSSGTYSPTLEQSIAMAYVDATCATVGTAVEIDIRGKRESATVVPLPFYQRI